MVQVLGRGFVLGRCGVVCRKAGQYQGVVTVLQGYDDAREDIAGQITKQLAAGR